MPVRSVEGAESNEQLDERPVDLPGAGDGRSGVQMSGGRKVRGQKDGGADRQIQVGRGFDDGERARFEQLAQPALFRAGVRGRSVSVRTSTASRSSAGPAGRVRPPVTR